MYHDNINFHYITKPRNKIKDTLCKHMTYACIYMHVF